MKQQWNDKTGRWEPPTNADRIRGMSDQELADFIDEISDFQADYIKYKGVTIDTAHIIDWLQQPAKEE